jgi:translation elongation factor EF-1alpha
MDWFERTGAAWITWKRSAVRDVGADQSVPHACAVGEPARISISAALRASSPAGTIKPGDRVKVLPSAKSRARSRVSSRWTAISAEAVAGQSVTLTLDDEIDISRGDTICAAGDPAEVANQFETTVLWMADEHDVSPAGRTF